MTTRLIRKRVRRFLRTGRMIIPIAVVCGRRAFRHKVAPGATTRDEHGEWRLQDRPWRLAQTYTLQARKRPDELIQNGSYLKTEPSR
jgi:hypothetical protein